MSRHLTSKSCLAQAMALSYAASRRAILAAVLLGLTATVSSNAALLLRYTFDEGEANVPTVDQGVPPAADGDFVNQATRSTNTASGMGYALDLTAPGGNHYVTGGSPAKLDNLTNLTLTCWVNLQGNPAVNDRLLDKFSTSLTAGFGLLFYNADATSPGLQFIANNLAGIRPYQSGQPVYPPSMSNQWVFVAVTYNVEADSKNVGFYTGGLDTPVSRLGDLRDYLVGNQITNSSSNFRVGSAAAVTSDRTPPALIDDVRVYDTELTLAQLEQIRLENLPSEQPIPGVTVYPPVPGLEPSDKYKVRVRAVTNDVNWNSVFAFQTFCKTDSVTDGYYEVLANWSHTYVNFETERPVIVEISRVNGEPIKKAAAHPARKVAAVSVADGRVYVTLEKPCNIAVDIDGQMDDQDTGFIQGRGAYRGPPIHTISVHANPPIIGKPKLTTPGVYYLAPGEPAPTIGDWRVLCFLPGVHDVGLAYPVQTGKSYYIPGDALVYGSFNNHDGDGRNIRIFGLGTLSGARLKHPGYVGSPTNYTLFNPINISQAYNTRLEGITVADPAHHSIMLYSSYRPETPTISSWVKVFGWRRNSDGINPFGNGQIRNCFLKTQDDGTYVQGAGISDTVYWSDANGCPFVLTGLASLGGRPLLINDCDIIYRRAFWKNWGTVFNMRGEGSGLCGSGVVFSNIFITDLRPTSANFLIGMKSPYSDKTRGEGDLAGIVFKNIIIATNRNGSQQPEILWGANEATRVRDLTFDNLQVGRVTVLANIFETNEFVGDLRFTNSTPIALSNAFIVDEDVGFSITNHGGYVGSPGSAASILAVKNNRLYVVEASADLMSRSPWVPVFTNTAPFTFTNTSAMRQHPKRFYRVVTP